MSQRGRFGDLPLSLEVFAFGTLQDGWIMTEAAALEAAGCGTCPEALPRPRLTFSEKRGSPKKIP